MMYVAVGDRPSVEVREGDWISLDGGTGEVYLGKLANSRTPDFENEVETEHAALKLGR
jgi:pyruvate,orthophosphate dikinase